MKLLITNVVYGDIYTPIFLNEHLKSFLDETNIPAFKDRVEYMVYTDNESFEVIAKHPNFKAMQDLIDVKASVFEWPQGNVDKYKARYDVQIIFIKESVKEAINRGTLVSCLAADLVVAKGYLKKIFEPFDTTDCDSIMAVPMRSCLESAHLTTKLHSGALPPQDLFRVAYANMHPLWCASHWESAQFSRMPYTMLWNSGAGLQARSFSVSALAFKPNEKMKDIDGVLDCSIPALCEKPYYAKNWTDCPMIGMEPLLCYYPPWGNHNASEKWVASWAKRGTRPVQLQNLKHKFFYPNEESSRFTDHYNSLVDQLMDNVILESSYLDAAK